MSETFEVWARKREIARAVKRLQLPQCRLSESEKQETYAGLMKERAELEECEDGR